MQLFFFLFGREKEGLGKAFDLRVQGFGLTSLMLLAFRVWGVSGPKFRVSRFLV